MQYAVILKRKAEKQYARLPDKDRLRVLACLNALANNPWQGKKLRGQLQNLYSWRVWPYRIIYTIERQIVGVSVLAIGHRKEVYEVK